MQSVSKKTWEKLIKQLQKSGLARNVFTDTEKMREYLEKHPGREGAERFMAIMNGVRNRDRKILRVDEHGKNIVWENENYFIAFSHGDRKRYYISLWDKSTGKNVGELYGSVENKGVPEDFVSVDNVKIDPKHRGKGLAIEMYRALIDFTDENIKGISSYLPDRINKKQVPGIWGKLGGVIESDYQNLRFMSTPNGEIYGFVTKEGDIYLDPERMNANTPFHEFGHLWNSFIKENNRELWEKGKRLIMDSPYREKVNSNPAYAHLPEDEKVDEALATAIGDRGELVVQSRNILSVAGFKTWLNEVWEWIGSRLGIRGLNAGQIENLTLDRFTGGAVADLMSGEKIPSMETAGRSGGNNDGSSPVRFQVDEGPPTWEAEEVRERLNRKFHSLAFRFRENWQDEHLPVKAFMEELRRAGVRIGSTNDFYQNVTHVPGKNDYELEAFRKGLFRKVEEAVTAVTGTGRSRRDVDNYVMLMHGLERNDYMREAEVSAFEASVKAKSAARIRTWLEFHPEAAAEAVERLKEEEDGAVREAVSKKRNRVRNKDYAGIGAIEQETGMPARQFIELFEKEVGDTLTDRLWKAIRGATDYSLDKLVQGGVITKDFAAELKGRYRHYVPLRGHDELTAEDVYDYIRVAGSFYTSPIRKAEGRRSRADDPFAYILQMAHTSINTANMNLLKQGLLRIAQHQDTKGLMSADDTWYRKSGDSWEAAYPEESTDDDRYAENVRRFDEEMRVLENQGLARRSGARFDIGGLFIKRPQKMEHAVRVFRDGKEYTVYINANPRVSRAVNGENRITPSDVSQWVGRLSRWMSSNMTSRNPAFTVTNIARDYGYGSVLSLAKEGVAYAARFQKNMPVAIATLTAHFAGKKSPFGEAYDRYVFEFLSNGGKTGFTHILELQRTKKALDREMKRMGDKGVYSGVLNGVDAVFRFLQAGNDIAENTVRLATYITSRMTGRDVQRSISDAKEITVNFNRRGAGKMWAAEVRPLYLFLNASLQGLANFSGAVMRYPKSMAAIIGMYALSGYLQPLLAFLASGEEGEEAYWRIPVHERRQDLIVPLGGDHFMKIPLAHELRLFHSLGETAMSVSKGRTDVTEGLLDGLAALSDILPADPLSAGNTGISEVLAPGVAKPVVQAEMNRSWTGSPIYSEWANEALPGWRNIRTDRKGAPYVPDWLSESLKWLDMATGGDGTRRGTVSLNPDKVNHWAKGYFGGLYTLVSQGVDMAGKAAGGKDVRKKDVPFLNRFYTGASDLRVIPDDVNERFRKAAKDVRDAESLLKDYGKRAEKGEIDLFAYAERLRELQRKVAVAGELKSIERDERELRNLRGEAQQELERRVAERKMMWVELYNKMKDK
jgi:ribosomal protein S18 acetylase RimI-like enzyme